MRLLLATPFAPDAARGNSIAAARLERGFTARGLHVTRLDTAAADDPERFTAAFGQTPPPDLALILHARHGAAAAAAARAAGVPCVVSLRGTDANEMLADPRHGPAIRDTLAHAAAVTVFHDAMRQQVLRHLPALAARVHCVPNGFDLPEPPAGDCRARYGLPTDACVWVSLAGLREVKRPDFPIEQLVALVRDYPHLRFLRAGPELEPGMAARVRALAAAHPWVIDRGVIVHGEVPAFLGAGDVFVSASRSEGMPHAVREAMGCGLALLLSDIPGHRVLAAPGREALFFDTPAGFQAAARRLIVSPDLRRRLGAAARRRIVAECAAQDEIGAYLALFRALAPQALP